MNTDFINADFLGLDRLEPDRSIMHKQFQFSRPKMQCICEDVMTYAMICLQCAIGQQRHLLTHLSCFVRLAFISSRSKQQNKIIKMNSCQSFDLYIFLSLCVVSQSFIVAQTKYFVSVIVCCRLIEKKIRSGLSWHLPMQIKRNQK